MSNFYTINIYIIEINGAHNLKYRLLSDTYNILYLPFSHRVVKLIWHPITFEKKKKKHLARYMYIKRKILYMNIKTTSI